MKEYKFSLNELRARKRETQPESAEAIGVSLPTWRKWEKDPGEMSLNTAYKVAKHFGVDIREIEVNFFKN